MKTRMLLPAFLVAFFYCYMGLHAQEISAAAQPEPIPGQYIVVMKESVVKPVAVQTARSKATDRTKIGAENKKIMDAGLEKAKSVRTKYSIRQTAVVAEYANLLVGFTAKLDAAEVTKLKGDANVAGVYQDYTIAAGPANTESNPAEVNAAGQTVPCAVRVAKGPRDGGANKSSWIWILDTGIDPNHPDLNVQTNPAYAKSFIAGQTTTDGYGHGTHMAGLAAAKNNNIGVVGVSAGAWVVPVKVLSNSGSGSFSSILAGLEHVFTCAIPKDVVLMCLGAYPVNNCTSYMPPFVNAINNLSNNGVWVVMSSGSNGGDAAKSFPACLNGAKVLTVAAITCDKKCTTYSNYGSPVDWVAVGTLVYSTFKNGGYATLTGTCNAAAVVAGIVHAKGGAPSSGGIVTCGGKPYKIATL